MTRILSLVPNIHLLLRMPSKALPAIPVLSAHRHPLMVHLWLLMEALLSDDESMEPAPASINAPGTASGAARGPWTAADFESFGDLEQYL